jgi:WD40 repeat protein
MGSIDRALMDKLQIDDICFLGNDQLLTVGLSREDRSSSTGFFLLTLKSGAYKRLLGVPEETGISTGTIGSLTCAPNGAMAAFVAADQKCAGGANRIWLLDLATRRIRLLVSNGRENDGLCFSPDGSRLAFYHAPADRLRHAMTHGSRGFALAVVSIATSAVTELAPEDKEPSPHWVPSWSPDGKWIVYQASYGESSVPQIYKAPASGGRRIQLTPEKPDGGGGRPVWMANGTILYSSVGRSGESGIRQMLSDGTRDRLLVPALDIGGPIRLSPDRRRVAFDSVTTASQETVFLDQDGHLIPKDQEDYCLGVWTR